MPPLSTVVQPVLSAANAQKNVREPAFKIVLANFAFLTSVSFGSVAEIIAQSMRPTRLGQKSSCIRLVNNGLKKSSRLIGLSHSFLLALACQKALRIAVAQIGKLAPAPK